MNFKDSVRAYLNEAKKRKPMKNSFGGGGCENAPLDQTMYSSKNNKKNKKQKKCNGGGGGCPSLGSSC
jgi:hypothetical protein